MLRHLTLEPVKCIKYQGYQQSHICGSQGTHVFSWGLFHSCRRSVRTPRWQHSTTVQRERKPSLDWWPHHMAMQCQAAPLPHHPSAPQWAGAAPEGYCWRLHQPLLINPVTVSQPCLHHCHCKAFKKKQQPLESWWHRVCREGLGLSAHLLHGIGAWLLPYTKTPF